MSDASLADYAELHCLSNFSFLRGASHPEELVERAAQLEYKSLAITDECSFAGIVRAHVEAKKHGLHLIIGTEVLLECGLKLILLAMDDVGYANLAEWITLARRRSVKGHYQMHRSDIDFAVTPSHGLDHLRSLLGCYALFVPDRESTDDELLTQADWVARVFHGRAAIAVELLLQADDDLWMERTSRIALISGLRMVATGHVLMHVRSRKPLQDTLTAIRLGTPLAECGLELQPNAEQHMRQRVRLGQIFPRALLEETLAIAARCTFNLDTLRYQYPKEIAPEGESLPAYFRRITYEGTSERFPAGIPAKVQQQI